MKLIHFTIAEMSKSSKAKELNIDNTPGDKEIDNLSNLIFNVLDPARILLGSPITVSSGYRSPEFNKSLNGAKSSQHMTGEAADLKCSDNRELFYIIKQMDFDQLIWEFGDNSQPQWIHVSYKKGSNRREVLRAKKSNGKTIYERM